MITKAKVKEYIQSGYHSSKCPSEKLEAISKAASKFINKYWGKYWVSAYFFEDVVNACLQEYSNEKDLSVFLEREKRMWVSPAKI
jgi:hypothetical protein